MSREEREAQLMLWMQTDAGQSQILVEYHNSQETPVHEFGNPPVLGGRMTDMIAAILEKEFNPDGTRKVPVGAFSKGQYHRVR